MKKPLEEMTSKELKAEVRKALKNGTLTEKELFAFMRSRRPPERTKRMRDEENKPSTDQ